MGSSKKTTTQKSTTENKLPEYMRRGSQRAVQMATDRTNQAYQGYDGQRIADLSQNEQMGIDMARQNAGAGNEYWDKASSALDRVGSFTDEGVAEQYMNPYMEQVVQPGLRRKNEAFESERAQRKATRGMQGAFGGRGQMWDNKFEQDFQEGQDEFMGAAYGAAYDSAANLHGQEQNRYIDQASAYGNLATAQSAEMRSRIGDLMKSGLTERTRNQADMDFKYLEHLEARDWDVSNLSTLVQTLATVPSESSQETNSTTTEKTKENPMKAVAGIASIAGAAIMTGGAALADPNLWLAAGGIDYKVPE
jgi:hypothetical protein